jgi:Class III cytochrome C family
MNYGVRILRDLLWVLVWISGAVVIFRAFSGASETSTLTNVVIAIGVLSGMALGILYYANKKLLEEKDMITSFDAVSGTWLYALTDNFFRISVLAVIAVPVAAALLHAGVMDGNPAHVKTMPPKALDNMRTILSIDGDRDGDAIVFNHLGHQEMTGGENGCVKCHHINKPGDATSDCYSCHSDMNHAVSIFNHATHQAKLGDNKSCDKCHKSEEPRSGESALGCADCHKENMGLSAGIKLNAMAPAYPNALHMACVNCHREMSEQAGKGCLACCDTCHQSVKHEKDELKVR